MSDASSWSCGGPELNRFQQKSLFETQRLAV